MSHVNVELHEKYAHEHIADSEYAIVHEEMRQVGFTQTAKTNGIEEHLPRGCYFSDAGTNADVKRAWQKIKHRLSREVSIEFTLGASCGLGLKHVVADNQVTLLLNSLFPPPPATASRLNLLAAIGNTSKAADFGNLLGLGLYAKTK